MYPYGKYEVLLKAGADLNTLADVGAWAPGLSPHIVRGVALINQNAVGGAGEIRFDLRVTHTSDTSRGDGDVAIMTIPNSFAAGQVLYKACNVLVKPGQQVVAQVTDVTASGDLGDVVLEVERCWEQPGNNTLMTASA